MACLGISSLGGDGTVHQAFEAVRLDVDFGDLDAEIGQGTRHGLHGGRERSAALPQEFQGSAVVCDGIALASCCIHQALDSVQQPIVAVSGPAGE
jgi:hypothetical protein